MANRNNDVPRRAHALRIALQGGLALAALALLATVAVAQHGPSTNAAAATEPQVSIASEPCLVTKLLPSFGPGQEFGTAVAVDGGQLFVSAPFLHAGDVHGYRLTPQGWVPAAWLVPGTPEDAISGYGWSLALSGESALVGNPYFGAGPDVSPGPGATYVFERHDNGTPDLPGDDVWINTLRLEGMAGDVQFGGDLDTDGTLIAVGSYNDVGGAAYVFRRDDKGTPSDRMDDEWPMAQRVAPTNPGVSHEFGAAVAVIDDILMVGDPENDALSLDGGAVHVFARDDGGTPADPTDDAWVPTGLLTPSGATPQSRFGLSLSIAKDRLLVGAEAEGYVFERDRYGTPDDPLDDVWFQTARLLPSGIDPLAAAGYAGLGLSPLSGRVSLSGDVALIGTAPFVSRAWVFQLSGGAWVEVVEPLQPDNEGTEWYGHAVALSRSTAVVGAFWDDDMGIQSGSAYVFDLQTPDPWSDLGSALGGTGFGEPKLVGWGCLTGGTPASLKLFRERHDTSAWLVLGLTRIDAAFKGGVLVPSPDVLMGPLPTKSYSPWAQLLLTFAWPAGIPSGTEFFYQYWILDPEGPAGWAASNGLQAVTP